MSNSEIINPIDADSDFSDDEYSGDEGYIDLIRSAPSNIHGSRTKPYTTEVSLGYIDEPEETSTFRDSRLGGRPIWLPANSTGSKSQQLGPEKSLLKCLNCQKPLALLVQLYAPLEDTEYERVLYIMICRNQKCKRAKGSVRAIRGVKRDLKAEALAKAERELEEKKKQEEAAAAVASAKDVGLDFFAKASSNSSTKTNTSDNNPFAAAAGSNPFAQSANPFATPPPITNTASSTSTLNSSTQESKPSFAEIAQKAAPPPEPVQTQKESLDSTPEDDSIPAFSESFYLYVEAEELDPMFNKRTLPAGLNPQDLVNLTIDTSDEPTGSTTTPSSDIGGSSSSSRIDSVAAEIEASVPGADDPSFQKFVDMVSQNPTQIVRYDRNNGARSFLLYSSRDEVAKTLASNSIPVNPLTREPRQLETQIMPHAISILEDGEAQDSDDDEPSQLTDNNTNNAKKNIQDAISNGMEWGTILVATPVVDTLPKLDENGIGYSEEWVGVQYEQF